MPTHAQQVPARGDYASLRDIPMDLATSYLGLSLKTPRRGRVSIL